MADEFTKAALYGIKTFNKKVKEKIGMQKLIELLNEFENTDNWENGHQVEFRESKIISKKFGFIKWLVNENKIDYEKARKGENSDSRWDFETIQPEYFMIMLLSVQDEPINFLISILK